MGIAFIERSTINDTGGAAAVIKDWAVNDADAIAIAPAQGGVDIGDTVAAILATGYPPLSDTIGAVTDIINVTADGAVVKEAATEIASRDAVVKGDWPEPPITSPEGPERSTRGPGEGSIKAVKSAWTGG